MLSEMKGSARLALICRHCSGEVVATGPAPASGGLLRPYAHAATGEELGADGHTAAPLDPDLRGSATAPKPAPADLGIDLASVTWGRSGAGDGSLEVAFPAPRQEGIETYCVGCGARSDQPHRPGCTLLGSPAAWKRGDWVLVRVAGDPSGLVSVFDRNEWECFLDGARNGEFDDAAAPAVM